MVESCRNIEIQGHVIPFACSRHWDVKAFFIPQQSITVLADLADQYRPGRFFAGLEDPESAFYFRQNAVPDKIPGIIEKIQRIGMFAVEQGAEIP